MNTILFLSLFSLLAGFPPDSVAASPVATTQSGPGYLNLHYNLDMGNQAIYVKVHTQTGCLVRFSRPFDDAWASDNQGNATGAYFKFLRWGTGADGTQVENQLMISSVMFTDSRQNLFVMVEGQAIELVLEQTENFDEANRKITVQLAGGKGVPFLPKREPVKAVELSTPLPLGQVGNRQSKAPNGFVTYKLKGEKPFILYTPNKGLPKLAKIEIVRGKKRRFAKTFTLEVPIEAQVTEVGGSILLQIPPYQLEKGEHLYLRVKYEGERSAQFKKLKKHWWSWGRS